MIRRNEGGLRNRGSLIVASAACALILGRGPEARAESPFHGGVSGSLVFPWGKEVSAEEQIREPTARSPGGAVWVGYRFLFVAAGYERIVFTDDKPIENLVFASGGPSFLGLAASRATAPGIYVALGGLLDFPLRPIGLVTTVAGSLGYYGVGQLAREVPGCVGCQVEKVEVDYRGGPFAGFEIGTFGPDDLPLQAGIVMSAKKILPAPGLSLTLGMGFALRWRPEAVLGRRR